MSTTELVFFIILSVSAAIMFLVFAIAIVYIVSILRQARRLINRAEDVADSVEAAAASFERISSPLNAVKMIYKIIDRATRTGRRKV